jgi:hypothetical protein
MTSSFLSGFSLITRSLLLGSFLLACGRSGAVERALRIESPATVGAGKPVDVTISASTDAGNGEEVGFLQAEVSLDDGKTWSAICYLQKCGPKVVHPAHLTAGPAGSIIKVRVRAAFRGGLAGDVDFSGAAIMWDKSWNDWKAPPGKHARIVVQ